MKKNFAALWKYARRDRFSWLDLAYIILVISVINLLPGHAQRWVTIAGAVIIAISVSAGLIHYWRKQNT